MAFEECENRNKAIMKNALLWASRVTERGFKK